MVNLDEQLNSLNEKLLQLAKSYQALLSENQHLKKELEKSRLKESEARKQTEEIQQKADALKVGSLILDESDRKALQKRIDTYLKDIEKCLQIINE